MSVDIDARFWYDDSNLSSHERFGQMVEAVAAWPRVVGNWDWLRVFDERIHHTVFEMSAPIELGKIPDTISPYAGAGTRGFSITVSFCGRQHGQDPDVEKGYLQLTVQSWERGYANLGWLGRTEKLVGLARLHIRSSAPYQVLLDSTPNVTTTHRAVEENLDDLTDLLKRVIEATNPTAVKVFKDTVDTYYAVHANLAYYRDLTELVKDVQFLHKQGKLGSRAQWVTEETAQLVLVAGDWPTIPVSTGVMVFSQRYFMNNSLAGFYNTLLDVAEARTLQSRTAGKMLKSRGRFKDTRPVGVLVQALQNPDREVRAEAVQSLGAVEPRELLAHIETVLNDKEGWVRLAGIQFLGRLKDADIVADLIQRDTLERDRLACLLGEMGDRRAIEPLLKVLDQTARHAPNDVEKAINLLTQFQDPRIVPALIAIWQKEKGAGWAAEAARQALLHLKAQVGSADRAAIEEAITQCEDKMERDMHALYKIEVQAEPPFTFETYKAFIDQVNVLRDRHASATLSRDFEMVQELTRKILIELPLNYQARLPEYTLAFCPICGGRVTEAIDTFSLSGAGWWISEPCGFGWFGRRLQMVYETLYPLACKRFAKPSYRAECIHAQAVHYGVNLNGIFPDDVVQERYVIIGSERPGILRPFIEREGSHVVIHALPVGRLDDQAWQPRYTAYLMTYFSQDVGAFQQSLLPNRWYDEKFLWPYELMDYDLKRWVAAGKVSWLVQEGEGYRLASGAVEAFPYGDVEGLTGRWAVDYNKGALLLPPIQGVDLYNPMRRGFHVMEMEEKEALQKRGLSRLRQALQSCPAMIGARQKREDNGGISFQLRLGS